MGKTSNKKAGTGWARNVDSKGRLTLGERFANRTVIVEERESGELVIKPARVIPEREAWLYENPRALAAVRTGLDQARAGKVSKGPDMAKARRIAKSIPDEEV